MFVVWCAERVELVEAGASGFGVWLSVVCVQPGVRGVAAGGCAFASCFNKFDLFHRVGERPGFIRRVEGHVFGSQHLSSKVCLHREHQRIFGMDWGAIDQFAAAIPTIRI